MVRCYGSNIVSLRTHGWNFCFQRWRLADTISRPICVCRLFPFFLSRVLVSCLMPTFRLNWRYFILIQWLIPDALQLGTGKCIAMTGNHQMAQFETIGMVWARPWYEIFHPWIAGMDIISWLFWIWFVKQYTFGRGLYVGHRRKSEGIDAWRAKIT